jgi:hypothetical protein
MTAMGSPAHQALIAPVTAGYAGDPRVLAAVIAEARAATTWGRNAAPSSP